MSDVNNLSLAEGTVIKSFGHENVFEFCNCFDQEKHILTAIAELLRTADLSLFTASDELSWGLQQLLDLYGEKQAIRVENLYNEVLNSPEYILGRAHEICEGEFGGLCTDVLRTLQGLDLFIETLGDESHEQAVDLRGRLLAIANSKGTNTANRRTKQDQQN